MNTPTQAPVPAQAPAPKEQITIGAWLGFLFGTVLCWLYAWSDTRSVTHNDSLISGGILVEALGFAFIFFVIASVIRGRGKKKSWNAVAQWYFWICLIGAGLMFSSRHAR